ncbi:MAG: TlpA disulfide reductase family protein [Parvularculaceae bacterium]|nr:TlpA disulfide reductase family protein [Parvularculaceae bacterium]
MRVIANPRLWLVALLGLGAAGVLYVISSAALSGRPVSAQEARDGTVLHDIALASGAMEKFVFAAAPRQAPAEPFLHDGAETTLAAFRGRTVLVNFWATWCAPCLKELPSLDALQREMGGKEFTVIAVAADPKGPDVAQAFLDKLGVGAIALSADPDLSLVIATGGSAQLPLSILYDAKGREIGRLLGDADWSSAEARALVSAAIQSVDG